MKIRTGIVAAVLAFASIMACGCSEGASSDTDSSKTESSSVSVSDSSSSDDTSSDKDSSSSDDSSSPEDSSADSSSKAKKKKRKKKKSSDSSSEADDSSAATTEKTESSAKETTSKASTTTAAETTTKVTVKTTAATTAKKPSEQALVWNYNGQCKVTFPASWKGRYVVEGNAVFCKKAHSKESVMGELFRIVFATKPDDSAEYSYVLGSDKKNNYYFAIINTGLVVDYTDKAAVSEMKSMYSQIESVIKNIRCAGTPASEPVKYYGHANFNFRTGMAIEGFEPSLDQPLTEINSKNKGLKVTGRFNSKDHSFTYTDSKGKSYKGWYVKKIDENNSSKAIPFGLVFLNGCVYEYSFTITVGGVSIGRLISNGSVDAWGYYKQVA